MYLLSICFYIEKAIYSMQEAEGLYTFLLPGIGYDKNLSWWHNVYKFLPWKHCWFLLTNNITLNKHFTWLLLSKRSDIKMFVNLTENKIIFYLTVRLSAQIAFKNQQSILAQFHEEVTSITITNSCSSRKFEINQKCRSTYWSNEFWLYNTDLCPPTSNWGYNNLNFKR